MDLGLEQAATEDFCFELLACVDISKDARQTIGHNRPNLLVIGDKNDEHNGDLSIMPREVLLEKAKIQQGEPDLVVGGPPCQTWSILGKRRGFNDMRGLLVLDFAKYVKEIQPRAFIMENVYGLLSQANGEAFDTLLCLFRDAGYKAISTWTLDAVNFGVPQYRRRVFIVGFRDDLNKASNLPEPKATHRPIDFADEQPDDDLRPRYRTVQSALADIPQDAKNNEIRIHGERVRKRYEALPQGGRDAVDHTDRLCWDKPSGTVLVGSSKGGGRPFIHPQHPRHLTVREAARLQGFPDEWEFQGSRTAQYRQVGNAVPPLIAKFVGQEVAYHLTTDTCS